MKVLVVKTSSLGDIVHTFPCIDWLKAHIPHLSLSWMVEKPFAALLKSHSHIDRVYEVNTKAWRRGRELSGLFSLRKQLQKETFDLAIDLQGNLKSGLLLTLVQAQRKAGLGWKSVPEKINCLFTKERFSPKKGGDKRAFYLSVLKDLFGIEKEAPSPTLLTLTDIESQSLKSLQAQILSKPDPIFIAFGSFWENKKLPHPLWERLVGSHTNVWTTYGSPAEEEEALNLQKRLPHLSILPKLSLPLLQNLFPSFKQVIGVDSLLLHLAGTTKVETLGLFGPSSAKVYAPKGAKTLQGPCPYHLTWQERCPRLRTCATAACIKELPLP